MIEGTFRIDKHVNTDDGKVVKFVIFEYKNKAGEGRYNRATIPDKPLGLQLTFQKMGQYFEYLINEGINEI